MAVLVERFDKFSLHCQNILDQSHQPIRRTRSHPSHELKNVHILRQIRVTKMTPQMSNFTNYAATKSQILAEKWMFFENFPFFSD